MTWRWAYILSIFIWSSAFAQELPIDNRTLISEDVLSTAIDPLHQIYYINKDRQVVKVSNTQNRDYSYSNLMIDDNTSIHVQNAFKVALYKMNVGDFLMLDNRLNLTAQTNFFDLGYFAVSATAVSTDNKYIWLFDQDMQRLIKLDQKFKEVYRSNNLTQAIDQSIQPEQIIEKKNKLYLLDKEKGVYIFDNVGNYIKRYPIEHADKIWLISNQLYFYRTGQLWLYDHLLFEEIPQYSLPHYTSIDLCKDFILGITQDGKLYKYLWK